MSIANLAGIGAERLLLAVRHLEEPEHGAQGCLTPLDGEQAAGDEEALGAVDPVLFPAGLVVDEELSHARERGEACDRTVKLGHGLEGVEPVCAALIVERVEAKNFILEAVGAMPRGLGIVLALDVEHDDGAREHQEIRDHEADPLAGAGWGHHQTMGMGFTGQEGFSRPRRSQLAEQEGAARRLVEVALANLAGRLPVGIAIIRGLAKPRIGQCQCDEEGRGAKKDGRSNAELSRVEPDIGRVIGKDLQRRIPIEWQLEGDAEPERGGQNADGAARQGADQRIKPDLAVHGLLTFVAARSRQCRVARRCGRAGRSDRSRRGHSAGPRHRAS